MEFFPQTKYAQLNLSKLQVSTKIIQKPIALHLKRRFNKEHRYKNAHKSIRDILKNNPGIKLPKIPLQCHYNPYITLQATEVTEWYRKLGYSSEKISKLIKTLTNTPKIFPEDTHWKPVRESKILGGNETEIFPLKESKEEHPNCKTDETRLASTQLNKAPHDILQDQFAAAFRIPIEQHQNTNEFPRRKTIRKTTRPITYNEDITYFASTELVRNAQAQTRLRRITSSSSADSNPNNSLRDPNNSIRSIIPVSPHINSSLKGYSTNLNNNAKAKNNYDKTRNIESYHEKQTKKQVNMAIPHQENCGTQSNTDGGSAEPNDLHIICISDDEDAYQIESTPLGKIDTLAKNNNLDPDRINSNDNNLLKEPINEGDIKYVGVEKNKFNALHYNQIENDKSSKARVFKNLKNHLHLFNIPIEIVYGNDLHVQYKKVHQIPAVKNINSWHNMIPVDLKSYNPTISSPIGVIRTIGTINPSVALYCNSVTVSNSFPRIPQNVCRKPNILLSSQVRSNSADTCDDNHLFMHQYEAGYSSPLILNEAPSSSINATYAENNMSAKSDLLDHEESKVPYSPCLPVITSVDSLHDFYNGPINMPTGSDSMANIRLKTIHELI